MSDRKPWARALMIAAMCSLPTLAVAGAAARPPIRVATIAGLELMQSSCGKHGCETWLQSATRPELRVSIVSRESPIGRLHPVREAGRSHSVRDATPGATSAQQLEWCAPDQQGNPQRDDDEDCSTLRLETVTLDADTTGVLVTTIEGYETLYYGWRLIVPGEQKLDVVVHGEAGHHSMMYDFTWGFVDDGRPVGYYFLQYADAITGGVDSLAEDAATYQTKRWHAGTKRFVPAKADPIPLWGLLAAREADASAFGAEVTRIRALLPDRDKELSRAERICYDIGLHVTRSSGFHRLPPAQFLFGKIAVEKKTLEGARRAFARCAPTVKLRLERLR